MTALALRRVCRSSQVIRIESLPDQHGVGDPEVARGARVAPLAAADRLQLAHRWDGHDRVHDISAEDS